MSSGTVDARGLTLHYLQWGRPEPTPVVLLHGAGGQATSLARLGQSLGKTRHAIALDQRGYGESDWAPVYGTRPMVDDIEMVLDRFGLPQVDLIGLSMGGTNAYVFAGTHPQRVRRLVVIASGRETWRLRGLGCRFHPRRSTRSFRGSPPSKTPSGSG